MGEEDTYKFIAGTSGTCLYRTLVQWTNFHESSLVETLPRMQRFCPLSTNYKQILETELAYLKSVGTPSICLTKDSEMKTMNQLHNTSETRIIISSTSIEDASISKWYVDLDSVHKN